MKWVLILVFKIDVLLNFVSWLDVGGAFLVAIGVTIIFLFGVLLLLVNGGVGLGLMGAMVCLGFLGVFIFFLFW